jgi:hypothetical protein
MSTNGDDDRKLVFEHELAPGQDDDGQSIPGIEASQHASRNGSSVLCDAQSLCDPASIRYRRLKRYELAQFSPARRELMRIISSCRSHPC